MMVIVEAFDGHRNTHIKGWNSDLLWKIISFFAFSSIIITTAAAAAANFDSYVSRLVK